jgi:hypothetical protein
LTLPIVLEGTDRSTCSGRNGPVNEFFDLDRVATSTPPPPVSPRPPVTVSAPSGERTAAGSPRVRDISEPLPDPGTSCHRSSGDGTRFRKP